ncbi:hypothetical protein K505DRAFT_2560 [Melanomma pulvis-pyrius CBS 109.77]|uniref:Uncharacterized protein n=1 Tax=Melanomma pulvis-pyrius CBS 109.77 TaxID=1314802 RepID=A0A6A6WP57_9PLEO|nr:hypothetical protein K505DRAFT_2560 [Melanomma pulvis-pyrius CBS 109.77]
MDHTFTYIPAGYKVLLYTSIALGLLWAVVVYYVNFPPAFLAAAGSGKTTRRTRGEKEMAPRGKSDNRGRGGGREERGSWMRYAPGWLLRARGKEERKRKPFDKPSKYALVPSGSSSSSSSSSSGSSGGGDDSAGLDGHSIASSTCASSTPWRNNHSALGKNDRSNSPPGIELEQRQRRPRVESPSVGSAAPDRPSASAAHAAPSTEQQSHSTPTPTSTPSIRTSTPLSPANPYLPAPLQRRSSSGWLRDHSVFFSSSFSATNIPHAHPSPAPLPSSLDDIDALEAQTSTGASTSVFQSPSMARYLGSGREGGKKGGGGYKRAGSWLGMVDGAVDRVVGKVARWTEDGRDEGLLLPVAKDD